MESYREGGKIKKRVIAKLGRLDLIPKGQLLRMSKKLARYAGEEVYMENEIEAKESFIFGPLILIRKIWEELGIGEIIGEEIGERVFVLTSCRLLSPQSEHGLSYFLKEYYVCDKRGRRWEAEWRDDIVERLYATDGRDRVKAEWGKLKRWYRTLDKLIERKEEIELRIYERVKNLFSIKVDIIFYDITSTYFEGNGAKGIADYGYSRDEKGRNKQILLGIVLADGLPIAHHVFAGNISDKTTIDSVTEDLQKRFKLRNIIFVADKGISTNDNIKKLRELEYKYIVGVSMRNVAEGKEILSSSSNYEWREYSKGVKYSEIKIGDERWILVDSEEKRGYEGRMREVWMEKGGKELEELKGRVRKGKLKEEKKIAYYLGSISKKYHVKRYFDWKIGEGKFEFWVDEKKLENEKGYEGKYLLRSTDSKLTTEDIIREYKQLWEIESCFREIKDFIKIRPHRTERRVRAHIFIAVLAYLIEKVLQRRIRKGGGRITGQDALEFTKSVKVIDIEAGKNILKLVTQKIDKISEEIFNLFGIKLPRGFKETSVLTKNDFIQRDLFY
ncbi:MAG: IS1634 family transposase [Candidatus Omnitrophica bacterium]|nr:IS1634 family transposase [Candidatus Omnitrophota bacterium]